MSEQSKKSSSAKKQSTPTAAPEGFSVDQFVTKWFPTIGILFVIVGLSYLLYEGVWESLEREGRMMMGFILGGMLLIGGFAFENRQRHFADSLISGGILAIYATLIYASKFNWSDSADQEILLSESLTLWISVGFAVAVAAYTNWRQSTTILLTSLLASYLMPFFIAELGEIEDFYSLQGAFSLSSQFDSFFFYFTAINLAYLWVATRIFLPQVGAINSFGLFFATYCLAFFLGESELEKASPLLLGLTTAIVSVRVAALSINARKFESENSPWLYLGYLTPIIWQFAIFRLLLDHHDWHELAMGLYALTAMVYFGAWYYLRNITQSDRHYGLYIGGVASIILFFTAVNETVEIYSGLGVAGAALIFGGLYGKQKLPQRYIAHVLFSVVAIGLTLQQIDDADLTAEKLWIFHHSTLLMVGTLAPLLMGFWFPRMLPYAAAKTSDERKANEEAAKKWDISVQTASLMNMGRLVIPLLSAVAILLLLAADIFEEANNSDLPGQLLYFTIPSLVVSCVAFIARGERQARGLVAFGFLLALLGYLVPFFLYLDGLWPAHSLQIFEEGLSWSGLLTIISMVLLYLRGRQLQLHQRQQGVMFGITAFGILALFQFVSHEILALFNMLDINLQDDNIKGIRALSLSVWWVILGASLLSISIRLHLQQEKNLGFFIMLLTICKILIYDLANVNTTLKVILFMAVGGILLLIGYYFSLHKKQKQIDEK